MCCVFVISIWQMPRRELWLKFALVFYDVHNIKVCVEKVIENKEANECAFLISTNGYSCGQC